jgi:hypothetical protein
MHYNFLFFHTWFKSNYFNCQMELSTKHELEEKSHIQMSICMPRFPRQIGKLPTCYRQRRDLFGEGMAEQSQRSQCLEWHTHAIGISKGRMMKHVQKRRQTHWFLSSTILISLISLSESYGVSFHQLSHISQPREEEKKLRLCMKQDKCVCKCDLDRNRGISY